MTWWMVALFLLVSALPLFFMWATLHELAHWLTVKAFVPLRETKFTLYPHWSKDTWGTDLGTFYWARVQWWYKDKPLTENQMAWSLFAPRWLDLLAVLLFPLAVLFGGWAGISWMTLWGGGLIDLLVGSIDRGSQHDMRRYSTLWGINPWIFRIGGPLLVLTSFIAGVTLFALS